MSLKRDSVPNSLLEPSAAAGSAKRYRLIEATPFIALHLGCLAALWTGVHLSDLMIAIGLYALRMFGITAGYHRYFSHRSFRTSRAFAFVLAFLAQSSAQRGILWWAGNHRQHHRFSDTDDDVHSPVRHGFWHAHFGWFFTEAHRRTDLNAVPDLAQCPELVWLDRHPYLPAVLTGLLVWVLAGWSGLVVGFLWSTVALWHATFSINSLAHLTGRRRYVTGDQSRNNLWLALLTFGEGWHNNHHHYQSAARQGFRWYEIDISYYALKALAATGLVWHLHKPPGHVVRGEQRLRRAVVEKAAGQLARSFEIQHIAAEVRAVLAQKRASLNASVDELSDDLAQIIDNLSHQLDERLETARNELDQFIHSVSLPTVPTIGDLRARAAVMFVATPSMNDIVDRGWQILIEDVLEEMHGRQLALLVARA
jgi:stearoyl-CoA desaturase (delta-9 desaturase)